MARVATRVDAGRVAWHLQTATWSPEAFTPQVYQTQISGKPRMSGARAVLDYFNIAEDEENSRVAEYADRKRDMVVRLIDAGEFTAYPTRCTSFSMPRKRGCASQPHRRRKTRTCFSARSGSTPSPRTTQSRRPWNRVRPGPYVADVFDADITGRDFARGKPDPLMFLAAAADLGYAPEDIVVVEDAAAGVQAAKAGRMAALGIALADDETLLLAAGADIVSSPPSIRSTAPSWPRADSPGRRK